MATCRSNSCPRPINRRENAYGGTLANRVRFLREVVEAIGEVVPMSRVGGRISTLADYNNARDPDPAETYGYVVSMLQELGVAYVHIISPIPTPGRTGPTCRG